jgi:hypothetical protein
MNKIWLLLIFSASLSFAQTAQSPAASVQLTPVPPRPTCVIILRNGACADLWKNYNQAATQRLGEQINLYANRQAQLEAAPLQQQVADLTKLTNDEQAQIKSLQQQMQADSATALVEKSAARRDGLEYGGGIGAGVILLVFGVIFGLRNFSVTKKPQSRAASA